MDTVRKKFLSSAELTEVVRTAIASVPECRRCFVEGVTLRHLPGDDCNWNIAALQGSGCLECLDALKPHLDALRGQYELVVS